MEKAFGLDIPRTLEEVCDPARMALLVYDMQIGILSQLSEAEAQRVVARIKTLLEEARAAGYRVLFTRHLSMPREWMGVFQLRQAMAWQRVEHAAEVNPWFLRDAPGTAITPELAPAATEAVFDKITMSAFEGTPIQIVLRDCGIQALAVVGVALEVGIEPTVRHAADLGIVPIVVTDACGGRDTVAMERAIAGLTFAGDALFTDTVTLGGLFRRSRVQ